MKSERTPPYLKNSIETILAEARSKITIHYSPCRGGNLGMCTGCQIIDHNDYSIHFYEPGKFEILEPKVIKCMDQRSAHQNGIIALKRWENEIRNFLTKPVRKMELSSRGAGEQRKIPIEKIQLSDMFPSVSRVQKTLRGRRVVIH